MVTTTKKSSFFSRRNTGYSFGTWLHYVRLLLFICLFSLETNGRVSFRSVSFVGRFGFSDSSLGHFTHADTCYCWGILTHLHDFHGQLQCPLHLRRGHTCFNSTDLQLKAQRRLRNVDGRNCSAYSSFYFVPLPSTTIRSNR